MAVQLNSCVLAALVLVCLAALLALSVSLGVVGSNLGSEVAQLRSELDSARRRVADLEQENDYLFEEKEEAVLSAKRSLESLPDLCLALPDPGPCASRVTRWFFSPADDDCRQFPWGGCRGNENNFLTISQCRSACHVSLSKPMPPPPSGPREPPSSTSLPPASVRQTAHFQRSWCQLPPESGPCSQRIPRFYHVGGGTCLKFDYGGCSGNQNNFFTLAECESKCGVSSSHESTFDDRNQVDPIVERVDIVPPTGTGGDNNNLIRPRRPHLCLLPFDEGKRCRGDQRQQTDGRQQRRYFFSQDSGDCVEFEYLGCGGNENNFAKLDKCRKKCR